MPNILKSLERKKRRRCQERKRDRADLTEEYNSLRDRLSAVEFEFRRAKGSAKEECKRKGLILVEHMRRLRDRIRQL